MVTRQSFWGVSRNNCHICAAIHGTGTAAAGQADNSALAAAAGGTGLSTFNDKMQLWWQLMVAQRQQQAARRTDRDVRHEEVGVSPANPPAPDGALPAGGQTPGAATETHPQNPANVQQRQQQFLSSMHTARQVALQALERRRQELAAAGAGSGTSAQQTDPAAQPPVTTASAQFLAEVTVPAQAHPHRPVLLPARVLRVTSQQHLQQVLAQLQHEFDVPLQHSVRYLLPAQAPVQPQPPPQPPPVASAETSSQQERLRRQLLQTLEQQFRANTTSDHPVTGNAGMLLGAAAVLAAAGVGASGAAPARNPAPRRSWVQTLFARAQRGQRHRQQRQQAAPQQQESQRGGRQQQQQQRRANRSEQQAAADREQNRRQQQQHRADRSEQQAAADRQQNRRRQQQHRADRSEQQAAADREQNRRQQQQSRVRNKPMYKAAVTQPMVAPAALNVGSLSHTCQQCNAKLWPQEVRPDHTGGRLCCANGSAALLHRQFPNPPPQLLHRLMTGDDNEAKSFQANVRAYNCLLQMAYSGIHLQDPPAGRGPNVLAINGSVYHQLHALDPPDGMPRRFGQLYLIDDMDEMVVQRLAALNLVPGDRVGQVWSSTLRNLQAMLLECNPYASSLHAMRTMHTDVIDQYYLQINVDGNFQGPRRYNAPTSSEVAGLMPGVDDEPQSERVSMAIKFNGDAVFIKEDNPAFTPLHFVLLHPRGEKGWSSNLAALPTVMQQQAAGNADGEGSDDDGGDEAAAEQVHGDKPRTCDDNDCFVSAEMPDPMQQPELHAVVTKHMLHGPCGTACPDCPCMVDGVCSKGFPKDLREETCDAVDGYPLYRRRAGAQFTRSGLTFDNSWVVPYNPWLSLKYCCHINVEVCTSISAVKYLYKYVYNGHDRALVPLQRVDVDGGVAAAQGGEGGAAAGQGGEGVAQAPRDEIKQFVDGRYVSASEAAWRLAAFELHQEKPNVVRLPVHCPGEQVVHFQEGEEAAAALRPAITKLTAWFDYNRDVKLVYEGARQLHGVVGGNPPEEPEQLRTLYHDLPRIAVWNSSNKAWQQRQRAPPGFMPIGGMYSVHPSAGERFYLRLLLCHVPGATSFEDLRRVPGHEQPFPTFKEACAARGLLQHDGEWRQCLQEAAGHRMPYCMRGMFASILAYNDVADAAALWNDYKGALCEDLLRTARREHPARQLDEEIEQQCLWILDGLLRQMGKSVADISGMPALQQQFAPQQGIVAQQLRRYPVQQAGKA
uniref:Helitron helicase-like domain-containing protein n=1 Tax=Tetradesmus obliquus TaxID=3088 RepID=A0A383WI43_TETOB